MLVDDEPNVLSALRGLLAAIDARQLEGEASLFDVFTSPEVALLRADEQNFDLGFSDYRMPLMSGVEFLADIAELQPSASRVIVSGNANRQAIVAAVNELNLMGFGEKPWNDQELRKTVVSILAAHGVATRS